MRLSRLTIISTALVPLALTLSACNGDEEPTKDRSSDSSEESEESESEESESEESESDSEESDDSGEGSGDYTEPGSELELGETATISYTYGTDGTGDLELALVEIEEGDASALDGVDNADGMVPFYLRFEVVGGADADNLVYGQIGDSEIDGLLDSGDEAGVLIGDVDDCQNENFDEDFEEGSEVEPCFTAVVPEGEEVTGARFTGGDDYDAFDGEPITWTE